MVIAKSVPSTSIATACAACRSVRATFQRRNLLNRVSVTPLAVGGIFAAEVSAVLIGYSSFG
jgi:hypothetical protein